MSVQNVSERVMAIVSDLLSCDQDSLSLESDFVKDLGADSLDIVELVMELEEEFGISIPEEEADKVRTVGDAIEHIEAALNAGAGE